jgi:hypothetical protein
VHSHRRRTLRVHLDRDGQPIQPSTICCCCEDSAGNRIASFRRAKDNGNFEETPRVPLASGHCGFCGRSVKERAA